MKILRCLILQETFIKVKKTFIKSRKSDEKDETSASCSEFSTFKNDDTSCTFENYTNSIGPHGLAYVITERIVAKLELF